MENTKEAGIDISEIVEATVKEVLTERAERILRRDRIDRFNKPILKTLKKLGIEVGKEELVAALKTTFHEAALQEFVTTMLTLDSGLSLVNGSTSDGEEYLVLFASRHVVPQITEAILPLIEKIGSELEASGEGEILTHESHAEPTPEEVAARC